MAHYFLHRFWFARQIPGSLWVGLLFSVVLGLGGDLPSIAAQPVARVDPRTSATASFSESNTRLHNPSPVQPQTRQFTDPILLAQRLSFPLQGVRPSRQRVGGFSRGSQCIPSDVNPSLIAVLPDRALSNAQVAVESTVSERPSFFAYIPPTTATEATFTISQENSTQPLYETQINLIGRPGVLGIALPPTTKLEVGTVYNWSLMLICDLDDSSANPLIEGYVQRQPLSPDLAQQLARTEVRDRPTLYANQGLWQDTVAALAKLRQNNPTDPVLNADWRSLLSSVNLAQLANAQIVQLVGTISEPPIPAPPAVRPPISRPSTTAPLRRPPTTNRPTPRPRMPNNSTTPR